MSAIHIPHETCEAIHNLLSGVLGTEEIGWMLHVVPLPEGNPTTASNMPTEQMIDFAAFCLDGLVQGRADKQVAARSN